VENLLNAVGFKLKRQKDAHEFFMKLTDGISEKFTVRSISDPVNF